MAERVVRVTLRAEIAEFATAMQEAANKTRAVGTEAERLAQKKQAFQQLGSGLTVVGGAMTALSLAVAKTGIEYNTLQQTSRAALSTLLGGAEAANAQMDKLDAFARTSPFAKTTFITAQQQMLAFGVESKKVIPYLDAIQDAVAAAGGSNQELSEIAFIMAQISSAGKITGQDLLQFGQRGVNAAELIGSQMGKTGAQIKADITAGTLGADEALDALAKGMKTQFDGAAANVKDTFSGAMDRVQAAWRDMSAELMKPLVNPNGGGLFVDMLNEIADVMRAVQKLPEPVRIAGGAIFALVGVAMLAAGAFIAAVPKVVEYKNALATLGTGAQRAAGLIGSLGKAAGAAAVFFALAKGAEAAATALGQMGDGAKTANETMSLLLKNDYKAMFDGIVPSINNMADAMDVLLATDAGTAFNRWGSDLFAFTGLTSNVGEARKQFDLMGQSLADMVNNGNAEQAAALFDDLRAEFEKQGYTVDQLNELMPAYQDALTGVSNESALMEDATSDASAELAAMQKEADEAAKALDATSDALDRVAGAAMSMSEANDKALKSINGLVDAAEAEGAALDGTNDASIKFRDSIRDVEQAHRDSADAILRNGGTLADAEAEWQKGRDAVIGMRVAKGEDIETAQKWADENLGSAAEVKKGIDDVYRAWLNLPENKQTKYEVEKAEAESALEALKAKLDAIPNVTYKRVQLDSFTVGNFDVSPEANGGIYHDKVKAFANSGFEPGIYPYTPGGIHKFAEEYSEAYISGDPARRARSEQVWIRAGQEFGFSAPTPAPSAPPQFNVVVQSKGGVDLLQYVDVRIDEKTDELGSGLRGF